MRIEGGRRQRSREKSKGRTIMKEGDGRKDDKGAESKERVIMKEGERRARRIDRVKEDGG